MNVEYVDHMGTDLSVVNAARVSFANKTDSITDADKSLISYLARGMPSSEWKKVVQEITNSTDDDFVENKINELKNMATHWVPFTHTAITLRVKAPVPIRTQSFKHKIGFTESEESRRYIRSRPSFFVPDNFKSKPSQNIKQGSGGVHPDSEKMKKEYIKMCNDAIDKYMEMIESDYSPEQARFILPQGAEVEWIWTGNLASYARYYNQRTDSHAQGESQQLSAQIGVIINDLFPISWKSLTR